MCAIAGLIGIDVSQDGVSKILDTMKRRGPDGNGVYHNQPCLLLHSRLAIIDLQNGKQPMELVWNGEKYILVYNGELYNTAEIRQDLEKCGHIFGGHSDTEVVLHAYVQWEEKCLDKLNGIFAFAVWKEHEKTLFIARDRIGVKPLFYTERNHTFLFASEIKSILQCPGIPAELDKEGMYQILLLGPGRLPGSGVFCGIKELEPGCYGYYADGVFRVTRYWQLTDRVHTDSFEDTIAQVRDLVTDAIRRQMISDVPLGTFLSGGLDSSIISAVCASELAPEQLQTFSVDYLNNDEFFIPGKFQPNADSSFIHIMQDFLKSDHHETVLAPHNLVDCLESATLARDLPGMADVDFSLLAFSKGIRKHVKVALSGECADEIFGGYPWYRDPAIREQSGFPWSQITKERIALMNDTDISAQDFVLDAYCDTCKSSDILPENSPLERRMKEMVNLNFRWFMQTLLDRKDRMSMYCSLEVRVPFCDYRIAEYLYGVPWEFKDYHGREKGLLRLAVKDLLPQLITERKKSPYPKTFHPEYERLVQKRLNNLLEAGDSPLFYIVNPHALKLFLQEEIEWPWYGQLMRRPQIMAYMLQIDFWLRQYNVQFRF